MGPGAQVFGSDRLTNPNGFAGVDGIFRLLPDGRVQRALAVLEAVFGQVFLVTLVARLVSLMGRQPATPDESGG